MIPSEFSWARVKERQAKQFDQLGDIASGVGGPGEEVDGHAVANACWRMAAYLKKQAADHRRAENYQRDSMRKAAELADNQ